MLYYRVMNYIIFRTKNDAEVLGILPDQIRRDIETAAEERAKTHQKGGINVAWHYPTAGPIQGIVTFYRGFSDPKENGWTAVLFTGDEKEISEAVKNWVLSFHAAAAASFSKHDLN